MISDLFESRAHLKLSPDPLPIPPHEIRDTDINAGRRLIAQVAADGFDVGEALAHVAGLHLSLIHI